MICPLTGLAPHTAQRSTAQHTSTVFLHLTLAATPPTHTHPAAAAEPVLQSNLKCCANRLCSKCEEAVAEKHEACPFCRAFLTTPAQEERKRQQQQQQQQQAQHGSSRAGTRSGTLGAHDSWSSGDGSGSYSYGSSDYSSDVSCLSRVRIPDHLPWQQTLSD